MRVILLLLTTNYRLDMCRRQYANDACNRGTAGNHCKNRLNFQAIETNIFFYFKINQLASLLIPYCFFVSLCLSLCIIVSSLCKNTLDIYKKILSLLFHHTLRKTKFFFYPSIFALDVNKNSTLYISR